MSLSFGRETTFGGPDNIKVNLGGEWNVKLGGLEAKAGGYGPVVVASKRPVLTLQIFTHKSLKFCHIVNFEQLREDE